VTAHSEEGEETSLLVYQTFVNITTHQYTLSHRLSELVPIFPVLPTLTTGIGDGKKCLFSSNLEEFYEPGKLVA
jgi:hypothetical protein